MTLLQTVISVALAVLALAVGVLSVMLGRLWFQKSSVTCVALRVARAPAAVLREPSAAAAVLRVSNTATEL